MTSGGTETWRTQQPGAFKRRKPRRAPGWALALAVIGGILVLGSAASFAAVQTLTSRYEGAVHKEDLLGAAGKDSAGHAKPPKVTGPLTFLVLGSDSRAGENANPTTRDGTAAAVGGQRSDTIILAQIPKSMDRAYFISLPRDSYVPMYDENGRVHGKDKLNAAFSRYKAAGMVQTVNHLTGGHIDYPMIVDFAAVHKLTELVGGVDVVVDKTSVDTYRYLPANTPYSTVAHCRDIYGAKHVRCLQFKAGKLHLDPQLAEYYVRQRVGLPGGDLDRAKRQQQYMKALMNKIASTGFATNPVKFDKLVRTAAGAVTADKSMPIQSLAFSLQQLRPSSLTFMSLPTSGFATEPGSGSVVVVDPVKDQELFAALNSDTLEQYILKHPPNDVSHGA